MAGKRYLEIGFADTVCRKRAILIILEAEFIESVSETLSYPKSTIWPTMVGPKKNFQNKGSQMAGKRYLVIGFCKYSV